MRISDWSSDVCSSDLADIADVPKRLAGVRIRQMHLDHRRRDRLDRVVERDRAMRVGAGIDDHRLGAPGLGLVEPVDEMALVVRLPHVDRAIERRSEEHTSELQSLMRISYAVFCLKKKNNTPQ